MKYDSRRYINQVLKQTWINIPLWISSDDLFIPPTPTPTHRIQCDCFGDLSVHIFIFVTCLKLFDQNLLFMCHWVCLLGSFIKRHAGLIVFECCVLCSSVYEVSFVFVTLMTAASFYLWPPQCTSFFSLNSLHHS